MTSILGVWDLTTKTPIGSIAAVYTFTGYSRAGRLPRSPVTGTRRR